MSPEDTLLSENNRRNYPVLTVEFIRSLRIPVIYSEDYLGIDCSKPFEVQYCEEEVIPFLESNYFRMGFVKDGLRRDPQLYKSVVSWLFSFACHSSKMVSIKDLHNNQAEYDLSLLNLQFRENIDNSKLNNYAFDRVRSSFDVACKVLQDSFSVSEEVSV